MLKKIIEILKKVVFNVFILYGYNLLAGPLNIIVPINLFTVGSLTIFGFPALLSFIIIHVLVF
jgi:hypothetical protein